MEDNFRLTLIIISAVVIVAIFIHGFWTLRKNKNPYKLKPEKKLIDEVVAEEKAYDGSGFDFTGVSKPRVVGTNPLSENEIPDQAAPAPDFDADPIPKDYEKVPPHEIDDFSVNVETHENEGRKEPVLGEAAMPKTDEPEKIVIDTPLYQTPVTQPKPIRKKIDPKKSAAYQAELKRNQLEINFGEVNENSESTSTDDIAKPVVPPKVPNKPEVTSKPSHVKVEPTTASEVKHEPEAKQETLLKVEPEVIILSVVLPQEHEMSGAALLPTLLTLGMRFGDMDIFHRYEDNAGNGKVTFSLANMLNPGTFNLDEMETFTTKGVSLFMTLPNAGDSFEVFEQMLNCAKQLALEFKGQVLDDKRSVMTKQTEQHYKSRIRDFSRKHRISSF